MGHLMPGHVLSLTAGAVAYESKCALKISFSSRDTADKELARARTSYGISYVASYLGSLFLVLSLFLYLFVSSSPPSLFLLNVSLKPMNNLHPSRCQRIFSVSAESRSVNDGILYASFMTTLYTSSIRKYPPLRRRDRMQLHRG